MIVSTLRIVVSEKREEALEILLMYQGPTSHQPGCISCQGFQGLDQENIILIEKWKSQAYLDRHICSSEYKKVLSIMEMSNQPPKISFHTASKIVRFELIEALEK